MSYMKKLVVDNNKHQEEKRIRRKKMARGPAVCAKKLTLETDPESVIMSAGSKAVAMLKNEEMWCAVTALNYLGWCQTTTMGQRGVERERREWMRANNVSYDTLRKHMKLEFENQCPVHTLRDITVKSGKLVKKGSMAWCLKVLDREKILVRFKVKGEGEESREDFETLRDDCEAVQPLLQWGWRPERPEYDSDSDLSD